jgi:hypothetical protein
MRWSIFQTGMLEGFGLAALFVDFKPSGDCTTQAKTQYRRLGKVFAVIALFALAACFFSLLRTGHWVAGLVLVLWAAATTVLQVLILGKDS